MRAGTRAHSSKNQQRWSFVVVEDRERLAGLSKTGPYAGHLAGAAAAIALITPDPLGPGQPLSVVWDVGGAAAQMMLVAWELGIGSCPATVYEHDLARELLGYPEGLWCEHILSFGYPGPERAHGAAAPGRPPAAGRGPVQGALGRASEPGQAPAGRPSDDRPVQVEVVGLHVERVQRRLIGARGGARGLLGRRGALGDVRLDRRVEADVAPGPLGQQPLVLEDVAVRLDEVPVGADERGDPGQRRPVDLAQPALGGLRRRRSGGARTTRARRGTRRGR